MLFSRLKSFTRDYFTLTSRERRGALVLAGIIIIQILAMLWINFLQPPDPIPVEVYNAAADEFPTETKTHAFTSFPSRESEFKKETVKEFFPFDPNTITDESWMQLGLSGKQVSVIRNYLRKGGRFRKKEDLSKMYCISVEEYRTLEPYISIIKSIPNKDSTYHQQRSFKKQQMIVELNSTDTLLLQELPLVGAGRARMIYRYREKLGGFYSVEQLREVFTIDSSVYAALLPFVNVDATRIRKFSVNNDSINHPYISRKQATILSAYRKQHGNFKDISDLQKVSLPDDQFLLKIARYATFE